MLRIDVSTTARWGSGHPQEFPYGRVVQRRPALYGPGMKGRPFGLFRLVWPVAPGRGHPQRRRMIFDDDFTAACTAAWFRESHGAA